MRCCLWSQSRLLEKDWSEALCRKQKLKNVRVLKVEVVLGLGSWSCVGKG
jgi:hypothetical protein